MKRKLFVIVLLCLVSACGGGSSSGSATRIERPPQDSPTPDSNEPAEPVEPPSLVRPGILDPLGITTDDEVSLERSSYLFQHYDYVLAPDYSIASVDYDTVVSSVYETWVMENRYLRVVLLPDFGGRVLSIQNKSTGSEALYQNPVGSPYLIGAQIFYYDWLMIMGGIFPTFPEPEHGKAWLRPWNADILNGGGAIATVAMSFHDEDAYSNHPSDMTAGITGINCTYTVSLKAGRAALDVEVALVNDSDLDQHYEYWTNTTLAPGSVPGYSRATDALEIIAPIDEVWVQYGFGVTEWDELRFYRNHMGEGIAYPRRSMRDSNFWGAINHDNEEGIFRIADNSVTPGLKIWTFGYDNVQGLDPTVDPDWHRPAIELWAGVTDRFFQKTALIAESEIRFAETYASSVALSNVSHAHPDLLINLQPTELHINFLIPDQDYRVELEREGAIVFSEVITPDAGMGNIVAADFSSGLLSVYDESGALVYRAEL